MNENLILEVENINCSKLDNIEIQVSLFLKILFLLLGFSTFGSINVIASTLGYIDSKLEGYQVLQSTILIYQIITILTNIIADQFELHTLGMSEKNAMITSQFIIMLSLFSIPIFLVIFPIGIQANYFIYITLIILNSMFSSINICLVQSFSSNVGEFASNQVTIGMAVGSTSFCLLGLVTSQIIDFDYISTQISIQKSDLSILIYQILCSVLLVIILIISQVLYENRVVRNLLDLNEKEDMRRFSQIDLNRIKSINLMKKNKSKIEISFTSKRRSLKMMSANFSNYKLNIDSNEKIDISEIHSNFQYQAAQMLLISILNLSIQPVILFKNQNYAFQSRRQIIGGFELVDYSFYVTVIQNFSDIIGRNLTMIKQFMLETKGIFILILIRFGIAVLLVGGIPLGIFGYDNQIFSISFVFGITQGIIMNSIFVQGPKQFENKGRGGVILTNSCLWGNLIGSLISLAITTFYIQ